MAANLDDYATEELDTLLRTLDNFVSDSDRVTSLELWELLAGCKCFFSNFNLIHCSLKIKFVVSFQRNITGNSRLPASDYAEKRVQRYK